MSEKQTLPDSTPNTVKGNGDGENCSIPVEIGTSVCFRELHKPETARTIHIVGSIDEFNPLKGKFMHHAPVPQALLGSRKGDIVRVRLPNEIIQRYEILDVFLKNAGERSFLPPRKKPLCYHA
ncbi:MAG TPA: GreA/GreB family elongation factor [Patescibacteria group bacterium]|nr:GreA/GreB family elongation factor [Patescibacteria group bacterium]